MTNDSDDQNQGPVELFRQERFATVANYGDDVEFKSLSRQWVEMSMQRRYVYNFDWFGRPIIQYPQDMIAMQELVWTTRPDLIVETGIAHGGSLVLSASCLAMLDMCDAIESDEIIRPGKSKRKVIGIDVDIRSHNRAAMESHPMASRIQMIEGSSLDSGIIKQVHAAAKGYHRTMVCLDSMHTHDHVLAELEAYAGLVTSGCYCVVFDTFVEDMPPGFFGDRPWDAGNNPKTAVHEFLRTHREFEIDEAIPAKLQVTAAPDGFLKRVA